MSAGKLTERVKIGRRTETNPDAPNDYGNTVAGWSDEGEVWAEFIHLRGGEAVLAGRLQGVHSMVVRLRASSLSRQITSDWRLEYHGDPLNIRDVTATPDRKWIDCLVQRGTA